MPLLPIKSEFSKNFHIKNENNLRKNFKKVGY